MDARAEIKPASVTESGLKVGTFEHLTSERSRIKRAIFERLKYWLANGTSDFEQRRRRVERDAQRKEAR